MSHGNRLFHVSTIAAIVLILLPYSQTTAQEPQTADIVIEVRVVGNRQIADSVALGYVNTRAGQTYSKQIVENDVKALLESGRFTGVQASFARSDGGVIVTFHVTERSIVTTLVFVGNKAIKDSELASELGFAQMGPLNRFRIQTGKQAILTKYRTHGYYFAEVTIDQDALTQRNDVIYRIVEGPKVNLRKVAFRGNQYFGSLKLAMKVGSGAGFWVFGLPISPGKLDMEQVEQDVHMMRSMYIAEGFLDAKVDRILEFSNNKKLVRLTFVIDEGARYVVSDTSFEGNSIFTDEELTRRLKLRQGEFYTTLAVQSDIEKVRETYGELGFIDTRVDGRYVYKAQAGLLDLIFDVDEGTQYKVGRITIRGNTETQARVIRREMRVFPDQLLNTVAVTESRHRLLETGLFSDVQIHPIGKGPGVSDILVEVEERDTSQIALAGGLSSRDGLIGSISYTQRNFDLFGRPKSWSEFIRGKSFKGAGQTLRIVAEPGTEVMRFNIEWFEPYLFDLPYSLGINAFLFTRQRETYDETRYGGVTSVGHRFKNRWYGELAFRIEGVEIDSLDSDAPPEVISDKGNHLLTGIKGSLTKDRTDSRWLPSSGDRFQLSFEQLVGDYNFGRAIGDYRIYRTVYVDALDRKHIFAARFTIGHIVGNAPVFERFYGGGIGSIRGFEYRGVSPRSKGTNKAIGGDTMVFAGCEYTFPIVGTPREGQVRGVVFLDTGTVEQDFTITTYRASIGAGIRWTVPFFGPIPISLDFGIPINQAGDDDTEIFSFSLGWTF